MPAVKSAKKPVATRGNSAANANPNTVLVVFLVIFVLSSIGLGLWGYYAQAGQDDLRKEAIRKSKEAQSAQKLADFYAFGTRELRLAIGQPLEAEEAEKWEVTRQDIMKEGGKYQDEPLRPVLLALMQDMRKEIVFDEATKKYSPSYKDRLATLTADLKKAETTTAASIKASTDANGLFAKLSEMDNKKRTEILGKISEGNKAALAELQAKFKYVEELFRVNEELRAENKKNHVDFDERKETFERNITVLQEKLEQALKTKNAPAPAAANPKPAEGAAANLHALVLDISKGKASWDVAVGRVVNVIDGKQVVINLGSEDNIKPQLSFNVFLPRPDGRPDRELKGTIEVIRAIDGKTALANITSQTNKDFPIKKDDALFNPFFGAHVAVAGQVNWFAAGGARGESPDEQVRSLNQFMQLLKNQGVVIDAYVDLSNGAIKGAINSGTRYLVRGDKLYVRAPAEPPPAKPDMEKKEEIEKKEEKEKDAVKDKDKDGDKEKEKEKEPEKKDKEAGDAKPMPEVPDDAALKEMNAKRIEAANESITTMVRQAAENGCFVISAANFAVVTGYRRLVTTVAAPEAPFRPSLPAFNVVPGGPGAPQPPPPAPKKAPEGE